MELSDVTLWRHEDFKESMPGTNPRGLAWLADRGKFPPYLRMTPRGEPLWARHAIIQYLSDVYQPLVQHLKRAGYEMIEREHEA